MCVKSCKCNSCYKKDTCSDCEYINAHKEADCYTEGVTECEKHIQFGIREQNTIDKNKIIEDEMKVYFGSRYFNEYHRNPVTAEEFKKLKELILTCINRCQ